MKKFNNIGQNLLIKWIKIKKNRNDYWTDKLKATNMPTNFSIGSYILFSLENAVIWVGSFFSHSFL